MVSIKFGVFSSLQTFIAKPVLLLDSYEILRATWYKMIIRTYRQASWRLERDNIGFYNHLLQFPRIFLIRVARKNSKAISCLSLFLKFMLSVSQMQKLKFSRLLINHAQNSSDFSTSLSSWVTRCIDSNNDTGLLKTGFRLSTPVALIVQKMLVKTFSGQNVEDAKASCRVNSSKNCAKSARILFVSRITTSYYQW